MSFLSVVNLREEVNPGSAQKILLFSNLSFSLNEEEKFLTILAPFRSGKSTLLKIIAGLRKPITGEVILTGNKYTNPDNKIIYIPEKASSFPWLSVRQNLDLVSSNAQQIANIIKKIGLEGYENHYPDEKSRGFRFRIAVGRALLRNPALILIDDSLNLIDPETKNELYIMLRDIVDSTNVKFLMATTDVHDAVQLSDRIILIGSKPAEFKREIVVGTSRSRERTLEVITTIEEVFLNAGSVNFKI